MSDGYQAGEAVKAIAEAAVAGGLGVVGALARLAASADDRPMLTRPGTFIRIGGDASLGVGFYLVLSAWGYSGLWIWAGSWCAGALGFAACHDIMMRFLRSFVGTPPRR